MMSLNIKRSALRRGVSLIELLVVTVIVLMVSAITMRTLAPALASRNLREGARMVNVALSAASGRAVRSGRPGGIWIEKVPGIPEAAQTIFQCLTPEPYSGDFMDSQLEAYTIPAWTDDNRRTYSYFANIVVPSRVSEPNPTQARDIAMWRRPDPKLQTVIQPGDLLRVNRSGVDYQLFTIDRLDPKWATTNPIPSGTRSEWIIGAFVAKDKLTSTSYNQGRVTTGSLSPIQLNAYPANYASTPLITPGSSPTTKGQTIPYQIIRQPRKQMSGAVQLPTSVCIDLNYSVIEDKPLYPRPQDFTSGTEAYAFVGGTDTFPTGGPVSQIDTPIPQGTKNPNYDMRPIIVTFGPNGAIDRVYCTRFVTTLGTWTWAGAPVAAQLHLLIGKMEKVPITTTLSGQAGINALMNSNLCDLDCFWVSATPTNGAVTTAPNSYVQVSTYSGTMSGGVHPDVVVKSAHNAGETGFLMGGK